MIATVRDGSVHLSSNPARFKSLLATSKAFLKGNRLSVK